MIEDPRTAIGPAWQALARELEDELRDRDPQARVEATIDPSGLLALDVRTTRAQRASARALARRYEEKARHACEHCGGSPVTATAGLVITVLCPDCTTEEG